MRRPVYCGIPGHGSPDGEGAMRLIGVLAVALVAVIVLFVLGRLSQHAAEVNPRAYGDRGERRGGRWSDIG